MFVYALDKLVFQEPDPTKSAGEVFVNMLYFSVISCTTIGFGDETPDTTEGRLLAGIFLLVGLPVFGNTIAVLTSVPTTRRKLKAEENVLTQFGGHLNCDELRALIYSAGHKGDSCTRAQFILHMLLKQAKVSPSDAK